MSTTTNFKRIALVAVAALGMGVLSSAPSQAAFSGTAGSQLTITVAGATGSLTGSKSDSTTAGTVSVTGLALAASDSYTVTSSVKSVPGTTTIANAPALAFMWVDTATSTGATFVTGIRGTDTTTARTTGALGSGATGYPATFNQTTESLTTVSATAGSANTYVSAKFLVFQESNTAKERVAGTYTYTLIVTPNSLTAAGTAQVVDITVTIAALTSTSTVANAANSKAYLSAAGAASADDAQVTAVATASNTPVGYITVKLRNAGNTNSAAESVTVTTTAGQVGTSTNRGRSVVLKYSTDMDVDIYADGTAGVANITVSTPSVTFATKQVTFYAVAPKTIVASVLNTALGAGANAAALGVKALDANGNVWAGTLYVTSDTVGTVSNAASSCSYNATNARHECSLTGVASGTAKITVADAATAALTTVTSTAVSVTVNVAAPATFSMAWDKASYAPGEKASLIVTVLDSAGKPVAANTFANLFSSTGITLSTAAGNGSDTVASVVSVQTLSLAAASTAYTLTTPAKVYTIYMPVSGGTFKATATGGTSLPAAGQVAVSASATVTDSGAAALAAVNALATTVASLKTLITTLTNLVLKIQKKVKA